MSTKEQDVAKRMMQFQTTPRGQQLTSEDLAKAEQSIIQFEKHHRFGSEICSFRAKVTISEDSHLYRLDPVIQDGVLRVGGHLKKAASPSETKHPAILCKDMHVATLILRHIYHLLGHAGRNHMLCRLRRKYWILNANSAARKTLFYCHLQKKQRKGFGTENGRSTPGESNTRQSSVH